MNNAKSTITLLACCVCLTMVPSASADFVGVTTVIKDDPDTAFLCTQGNGDFVPGPLTVCNVYAVFDNPTDRLLGVAEADLQVFNGANPDGFYQHPAGGNSPTAPACDDITAPPPFGFADLICDSFVTIGVKCGELAPADATGLDGDFDLLEFLQNGHVVGGWFNASPPNGQGDAGNYPDLQVLFLQSSVAQGLSLSGDIVILWEDGDTGAIFAVHDVPIECDPGCPNDYPCDDGDPCTEDDVCNNQVCQGTPIDCDDDNECTDDDCVDGVCIHTPVPDGSPADDGNLCTEGDMCVDGAPSGTPVQCPKGQVCDPAIGECVEEQDPCECLNGRVTLCHMPPGNLANARTITVGCAARDRHLAHGDTCGPCQDDDG